jgi:hypothetical protein
LCLPFPRVRDGSRALFHSEAISQRQTEKEEKHDTKAPDHQKGGRVAREPVNCRDHHPVPGSGRRVVRGNGTPASYFFFVDIGTAGRSCRLVKADCASVGFGFSCFGFFCSRLLRF